MTAPRSEMLFTSPKLSKSSLLLSLVRLSSKEDGLEGEGWVGGGMEGWEDGGGGGESNCSADHWTGQTPANRMWNL